MKVSVVEAVKWSAMVLTVAAAAMASLAAANQTNGASRMNPRLEQQDGFTMVGISVRTSNAKEQQDSQIGKQWARLMKENVLAAIPNRADQNTVAVYTDYARDANGDYTYVLGARVTKVDQIPAGMVAQKVPASKYAVFTSDRGPVQKVVVATWTRIWNTPKDALGGNRAFKTDYELYDQRAQNPADAVVDIYIGIR